MALHSADSQNINQNNLMYNKEKVIARKSFRAKHATTNFNNLLTNLVNINDYALKKSFDQSKQMINYLTVKTDDNSSRNINDAIGSPDTAKIKIASQKVSPEKNQIHLIQTGKRRSIPVSQRNADEGGGIIVKRLGSNRDLEFLRLTPNKNYMLPASG